jgi:hypothetical protein
MSKNNDEVWKTKYGFRRVRHEAPTLGEAIAAAQGLSDELNQQAEIAASLIGLPRDQVHTELLKVAPPSKNVIRSLAFGGSVLALLSSIHVIGWVETYGLILRADRKGSVRACASADCDHRQTRRSAIRSR